MTRGNNRGDGAERVRNTPGHVDKEAIEKAVASILRAIGESPEREGLRDTPRRIADLYAELFSGLHQDPRHLLTTLFEEKHREMVVVKDIPFYSMCVPSRQHVDAVGGTKRAAGVMVGDWLYTLDRGEVRTTRVVAVSSRRAREVVRLTPAGRAAIFVTPEHPIMTPEGWRPAGELKARDAVEWVFPRRYCQRRYPIREGYDLGYVLGAVAAHASSNVGFIRELGQVVGSRPAIERNGMTRLYVSNRWHQPGWYGKPGFVPSSDRYDRRDSDYVQLDDVTRVTAGGRKPYKVYTFTCAPYPTFCISGVLTHNCEHHLMPFHGLAHVGYIPQGRIVGISKIARLVETLARRPQVQERLTSQVADLLMEGLQAGGAGVVIEAVHLCMTMRGVKKPGSKVVTSASRGLFRENPSTRAEFLSLLRRAGA